MISFYICPSQNVIDKMEEGVTSYQHKTYLPKLRTASHNSTAFSSFFHPFLNIEIESSVAHDLLLNKVYYSLGMSLEKSDH